MKKKLLTKRLLSLSAIAILMVMMALTVGCGGDDDDSTSPATPDNPGKPGTSYTLSLSASSLSFDYDGGQQTVTITTNASGYSAESSQPWCRTTQSATTLTVTVDANTTIEQRIATVTVKTTEGNKQQTVTVTQQASTATTESYCTTEMPDVWVFNKDASYTNFILYTNIDDFSITCSESWCTAQVQNLAIEDRKQLIINTAEYDVRTANDAYVYDPPRMATVHITGGGVFDRTITIVQNTNVAITTPLLPNLGFGCVLSMSADGETSEVFVEANCYSWKATTDASWITLSKKDHTTLVVTIAARTDDAPRSATVTIVNESDERNNRHTFTVADKDAVLTGNDYGYGDDIDWDE